MPFPDLTDIVITTVGSGLVIVIGFALTAFVVNVVDWFKAHLNGKK